MLSNENKPASISKKFYLKPLNVIILIATLVGLYYFLPQLGEFKASLLSIRHASWYWVIAGACMTALTFLSAAYTQYAAGNFVGKFYIITLLQLAGSFVNHFLPFSLGGIGLTSQYYEKLGKKRSQAISVAVVPIVFGLVTTIVIIASISPVTFAHLAQKYHLVQHSKLLTVIAALGLLVGLVALPIYKRRARTLVQEAIIGLKEIRSSRQILALIAGSLAISFSAAFALLVSVISVHASVAFIDVFVLYITAAVVSNFAPTPGGIGATEAVLAFGLNSVGVPLSQAVAATLIYRFISFWLPIPFEVIALRLANTKLRQLGE